MELIALAIPVFFLLIGVEVFLARWQQKRLYRLNDSLTDLSCGVFDQVLGVFTQTAVFAGYIVVHERARLADVPTDAVWAWVACFLGVDFFYYWFHRVSHESNLPWGAHIVHHQSEEFNLAVALRQGAFQPFFSWLFYLPLAWLGFPPAMFLTCSSVNTLYQFWIHTRAIGRLGPLEWVFNTPSHHRVHHGRNPRYIDKNYAGSLIVWDRLFGSFEPEAEEVVYGITKPVRSWNPLWVHFSHWAGLVKRSRGAPSLLAVAKLWLAPPGYQPPWAPPPAPGEGPTPLADGEAGKYDARPGGGLLAYVTVQFVLTIGLAVLLLFGHAALGAVDRVALAAIVLAGIAIVGGLLERRRWAFYGELVRLAALWFLGVAALARVAPESLVAGASLLAILVGGLGAWFLRQRGELQPAAAPALAA